MPQGLFQPLVLFFSPTNSPATFQAMMNKIFRMEVAQGWLSVYMDNIVIHTKPLNGETEQQHEQQHKQLIHQVLKKLETHDLYLKPEKCKFLKWEIEYLGVIVRNRVLKMNPKKLESIKNWATPNNLTEIQKFLGFTGYYRYFIPNYLQIARPLLHLTKKTTPWEWTKTQQLAFDLLKALMCEAPVLIQPNFEKKFFLQVNASAYGMGTVLSQEGEITTPSLRKCRKPALHPIAFYSATFTPTEWNYDIYNRELLAVMKVLYHWRPYLAWTNEPFTILTDHANLTYWKAPRKLDQRIQLWNGTHPREYKWPHRHTIMNPRDGQRRKQQPRYRNDPSTSD